MIRIPIGKTKEVVFFGEYKNKWKQAGNWFVDGFGLGIFIWMIAQGWVFFFGRIF